MAGWEVEHSAFWWATAVGLVGRCIAADWRHGRLRHACAARGIFSCWAARDHQFDMNSLSSLGAVSILRAYTQRLVFVLAQRPAPRAAPCLQGAL